MKRIYLYQRKILCFLFVIVMHGTIAGATETVLFPSEKGARTVTVTTNTGNPPPVSNIFPYYETSGKYSQFAHNTFYYFGKKIHDNYTPIPESGVFFIVSSDSQSALEPFVTALLKECSQRNFASEVTVILSGGDTSVLPSFYQVNIPAGIKYCTEKIEPTASCVFVLTAKESPGISVGIGADGKITQRNLPEHLASVFKAAGQPFVFTSNMAERYYLNWNKPDPYLEEFMRKKIPALSVAIGSAELQNEETIKKIATLFASIAETPGINSESSADHHYLYLPYSGTYHFITENDLVHIAVICCIAALFAIFTSGIFKKRKERQARAFDILHIWWLIPLYICVTAFSFVMAKVLVLRFSISLTGNPDIWAYNPLIGIGLQVIISALFLSLLPVIEQIAYFPERSSIYGYLSSIAALCNVFIFMSAEFSLSVLFVWSYICSFAFYHCKKTLSSIFWTILMYLPMCLLFIGMSFSDIGRLFVPDFRLSSIPRYVLVAFIILPLELNIARIKALNGKMGKTDKFRMPIATIFMAVITIAATVYLLVTPRFTREHPQAVHIGYLLNDTNTSITAVSPYTLPEMGITINGQTIHVSNDTGTNLFSQQLAYTKKFFEAECVRRTILERSTNKITIRQLQAEYPPIRYDITVINENGTAVYDATIPFELQEDGTQGLFLPGECPGSSFSFDFSGSKDDALIVQIRGLFATKPDDITVRASVPVVYTELIDAVQTIVLEPGAE